MQKARYTLLWIFCALVAGTCLGLIIPDHAVKFMPLSGWILQLIKAAATPLVFFAILEAILRFRVSGRDFIKLFVVTSINASLAVAVGLLVANYFKPGDYIKFLSTSTQTDLLRVDLLGAVGKQLPSSIIQPFAENNIMPLVIIALAFAFAWRCAKKRHLAEQALIENWENFISFARTISEIVLIWVVKLVPLAVFASSAKLSAQHGLHPFKGLGHYIILCLLGMIIHLVFVYGAWIIFYIRMSIILFWRFALKPAFYAFSVNSSLVALPLTLKALDELGVSRRASTLAACVGTNLNNDGIILYEGFTLIALAQASGIDLSIAMQIFAALYCIIAAMGVAGVPEAGVVALTLVLTSLKLPIESLAVLLSVDWIIARGRSLLNTSCDMVSSLILDRWIKNSDQNL